MNIWHLTDLYPPAMGGLERHVEGLSQEMARRGHNVSVLGLAVPDQPEDDVVEGVRVVRLDHSAGKIPGGHANPQRPFHPASPDPHHVRALSRHLRSVPTGQRPDIVVGHTWSTYSWLAVAGAARFVTLHTLHDYGFQCALRTLQRTDGSLCAGANALTCFRCASPRYGAAKALVTVAGLKTSTRVLHPKIASYIAVSQAVKDATAPALSGRAITVIPSFVSDTVAAKAQRARDLPRPECVPPTGDYILVVGALSAHKGIDVALQAHARLRATREAHGKITPSLVLIGTPQHDTPTSWPEGVMVSYNQPHDTVIAAWAHASIGWVPSTWAEPLGQVAIEAQLAHVPVVVSAIGGLTDIVTDSHTGLTVPPSDPSALADATARLLDDAVLRSRVITQGACSAHKFTLSPVTDQVLRQYEKAVSKPRITGG